MVTAKRTTAREVVDLCEPALGAFCHCDRCRPIERDDGGRPIFDRELAEKEAFRLVLDDLEQIATLASTAH